MRQELHLELKQVITPQHLLNLKILALPNIELETLIRNEIQQNPVLEILSEEGEDSQEQETDETENESNEDEFDIADLISDDNYSLLQEFETYETTDKFELTPDTRSSFEDTLLPIVKNLIPEQDYAIAEYIIGNISDDGFLTITTEEIAQHFQSAPEHTQEILDIIKHIDPGGIGAKNLQEALVCQMEVVGFEANSVEIRMIRDYYDILIKRNFSKLQQLLEINDKQLAHAISHIHSLETRPARRYSDTHAEYIAPDFSIEWQGENLIANINDETFPVLRVAPRFREIILNPKSFTQEEVDFARKRVQNALMIIKGIESRKTLLKNILKYLVENQKEFFVHGKKYIKPILIKDIAGVLNVHISTVSRAVQNKYVETPVGIFPMRFFFTSGIGEYSRTSIKEKIKELIDTEEKANPYTDDQIVILLGQQNIKLSRRTVAKYREEMNIAGSGERIAGKL